VRVALVDPGPFLPELDHDLALSLALAGAEVELLTAPFVHGARPEPRDYRRLELFARALGSPRAAAAAQFRFIRRAYRLLAAPFDWRRVERHVLEGLYDVLHLVWPLWPRLDRRSLVRLRRRGVRTVVTLHNPERRIGDPSRVDGLASLLAGADAVVVHSAAALAAVGPRIARASLVREVPLAVPHAAQGTALDRGEARRRLGLPIDAPLALFFGLWRPYKGLEPLLEAFTAALTEVPRARLLVAGAPRMATASIERRARQEPLADRVVLEPRYLSDEEIGWRFAAADVVVLPYLAASQSAVLVRALGYARAVIASRVGGLAEMVRDGVTGRLVTPNDVAELARALVELLGDPSRAADFGAAAGRLGGERFTPRRQAEALGTLYRELLAAP
jgi:glycosyltransferase involved in cell wall biosynthesis